MDEHSFRQTQTAMSAFYLLRGGPFFAYETPLFGAPWSIPFELPVYQWLVAKFSLLTNIPLEQSARLVGRGFFYLLLWPLLDILQQLGAARRERLVTAALYLLSPLYLYWSRTVLIESTALFFAVAYLAFTVRAMHPGRIQPAGWGLLLGASAAGAIAATTKVTTFYGMGAAAGFFLLYSFWRRKGGQGIVQAVRSNIFLYGRWILTIFVLPLIAAIIWTKYSDQQKALNPLAEFITSNALGNWNFGTLEQRLSSKTWYMFFRKTLHDAIGHRTTWILSLLLLPFLRARWRLYFICCALFLLVPMTFTNLHIAHNYYPYANGIFLVVAIGIVLGDCLNSARSWLNYLGIVLLFTAAALEWRQYHNFYLWSQRIVNSGPRDFGAEVKRHVPEDKVVLVYGVDWYPAIPYYMERRVIMDRGTRDLADPAMRKALTNLAATPYTIGAVALCGEAKGNQEIIKMLQSHSLKVDSLPAIHSLCDLHIVK
jgi:hypothetical protein